MTREAPRPAEPKGPKHVAVIMDGNGRWAKARGRPRSFGHRAGVQSARRVVTACRKHGVEAITVFAFFSARSTSGISGSSASCTPAGAAGRSPSPVFRPRTVRASTSVDSRTSGKACGLPISACDTDFASRCDCISA